MAGLSNIKGILIDFGGTIDTNGIHWAEVLWSAYHDAGISVEKSMFREAYKHGERTLALQPIIRPDYNFYDVLKAKTVIQLQFISERGGLPASVDISAQSEHISSTCYGLVRTTVTKAKPVLEDLSKIYSMVLVSNFYGNICSVLEDLGIDKYFKNIVESAVVGVRKPDPAIFTLGVRALGFEAAETVVVGDSYSKDIVPAREAGCRTVWLKGKEWDEPSGICEADAVIYKFEDLKSILSSTVAQPNVKQ